VDWAARFQEKEEGAQCVRFAGGCRKAGEQINEGGGVLYMSKGQKILNEKCFDPFRLETGQIDRSTGLEKS
jgi:hypothetical protein